MTFVCGFSIKKYNFSKTFLMLGCSVRHKNKQSDHLDCKV